MIFIEELLNTSSFEFKNFTSCEEDHAFIEYSLIIDGKKMKNVFSFPVSFFKDMDHLNKFAEDIASKLPIKIKEYSKKMKGNENDR